MTYTSTHTFASAAEAAEHFAIFGYTTLPVKGARTLAYHHTDDNGRPIITFARQHLSNRLTYTFTEQPRRG